VTIIWGELPYHVGDIEGQSSLDEKKSARERILEGGITNTLLWLAWPAIIANYVNISYNFIDSLWLGRLGKIAFDAPTVSWPLLFFLVSFASGYINGGISIIAQYYGAGDVENARKSAGKLFLTTIILAILVAYPPAIFAPQLLSLMNVPHSVLPLATTYLRIILLATPIADIGIAFTIIAHALGDTRTPTIVNVASSVTNIILDPFLIFGLAGFPRLEVTGAALATVIARSITAAYAVYMLFYKYDKIRLGRGDLHITRDWLHKLNKVGFPLAIQRSTNNLGFVIMMSIVSYFGPVVIAAYGVSMRVIELFQGFSNGLSKATSIMVGQSIGAGKKKRAVDVVNEAYRLIALAFLAGAAFILLEKSAVVSLFIKESSVIAEGSIALFYFAISLPFYGIYYISSGVASGSGHTKEIAMISIVRLWVLRILLSLVLAYILSFGSIGIWLAISVSNILAGLIAYAWVQKKGWLEKIV
jgi:putative MATE family efflux protein